MLAGWTMNTLQHQPQDMKHSESIFSECILKVKVQLTFDDIDQSLDTAKAFCVNLWPYVLSENTILPIPVCKQRTCTISFSKS